MNRVIVVTPMKAGVVLPEGFAGKYPLLTIHNDAMFTNVFREETINVNRARLQSLLDKYNGDKYEIVICKDSDVLCSPEQMDELVNNVVPGKTVAMHTKNYDGDHVCCACCALTMKDYLQVRFLENPRECACKKYPNPEYCDIVATESENEPK